MIHGQAPNESNFARSGLQHSLHSYTVCLAACGEGGARDGGGDLRSRVLHAAGAADALADPHGRSCLHSCDPCAAEAFCVQLMVVTLAIQLSLPSEQQAVGYADVICCRDANWLCWATLLGERESCWLRHNGIQSCIDCARYGAGNWFSVVLMLWQARAGFCAERWRDQVPGDSCAAFDSGFYTIPAGH